MKKFLFFATLVACSLMIFSCKNGNTPSDPNEAAIAKVKADAQGSWVGDIKSLLTDDKETVTVTFTEKKITVVGTETNENVNITAWKCVDGKEVWVTLDDELKSALYVAVSGDQMVLRGSSSYTLNVFPETLTRKK